MSLYQCSHCGEWKPFSEVRSVVTGLPGGGHLPGASAYAARNTRVDYYCRGGPCLDERRAQRGPGVPWRPDEELRVAWAVLGVVTVLVAILCILGPLLSQVLGR